MEQDYGYPEEEEEEEEDCDEERAYDYGFEYEDEVDEMLDRTFRSQKNDDEEKSFGDDVAAEVVALEEEEEEEEGGLDLDDSDDSDDSNDSDAENQRQRLRDRERYFGRSVSLIRKRKRGKTRACNNTFKSGNEYFCRRVLEYSFELLKEAGRYDGKIPLSLSSTLLDSREAPLIFKNMNEYFETQAEVAFEEAKAVLRQGLRKLKKAFGGFEMCKVIEQDNVTHQLKLQPSFGNNRRGKSAAGQNDEDWAKSGSVVLLTLETTRTIKERKKEALGIVLSKNDNERNGLVYVQISRLHCDERTPYAIQFNNKEVSVIPLGNVLTQKRIVAVAITQPKFSFEAQVLGIKCASYTRFSSSDDSDSEDDVENCTENVKEEFRLKVSDESDLDGILNPSQRQAMEYFLEDNSPGFRLKICQGPPGTGKTYFAAILLSELARSTNARILFCAPSNKATMVALETFVKNIRAEEIEILDCIALYGVEEALESAATSSITMDNFFVHRRHSSLCDKLKEMIKTGAREQQQQKDSIQLEMKRIVSLLLKNGSNLFMINEFDLNSGTVEAFIEQIEGKTKIERRRNMGILANQILANARITFCTLGSCGGIFHSGAPDADILIVDEAGQCLENEMLLAFARNPKRCLLIGDDKQLPPTVMSQEIQRLGYDKSLMERLKLCYNNESSERFCTMLKTQYRMHPEICAWPSRRFYSGKLKNAESVCKPVALPYGIVNVHSGKSVDANMSKSNAREAEIAGDLVFRIRKQNKSLKIGVITFYNAQVRLLQKILHNINDVFVSTVDSFQGSEADVIILSCVRTSTSSAGFLKDSRRLNVALTRAKTKLIVLLNADVIEASGEILELGDLRSLISDAKRRQLLFSESAYPSLVYDM